MPTRLTGLTQTRYDLVQYQLPGMLHGSGQERAGGHLMTASPELRGDVTDVDGKIVKFYATDDVGHTTISSYTMSVTVLPSHTYYTDPDSPAYEGGLPSYITWMSDGQGIVPKPGIRC